MKHLIHSLITAGGAAVCFAGLAAFAQTPVVLAAAVNQATNLV